MDTSVTNFGVCGDPGKTSDTVINMTTEEKLIILDRNPRNIFSLSMKMTSFFHMSKYSPHLNTMLIKLAPERFK